jgi:hypothetical protein
MEQYPLLFSFSDKVAGKGYLAAFTAHGAALAGKEEEGWWVYGVKPGGLAESGTTLPEAYVEFRKSLLKVLFDLAAEAPDFYAFRRAATEFFNEVNEPTRAEWEAARALVRQGKLGLEGIRREPAESPRRIEIKELQTIALTPEDNRLEDEELGVAA